MAEVSPDRPHSGGMTLIEVMVAAVLMLMLLFGFYAVSEALQRSQVVSDARLEARQALRTATRAFRVSSAGATAFFSGDGSPQTIGNYPCLLPTLASSSSGLNSGDTVAVAVPLDLSRPIDPAIDPRSPNVQLESGSKATPDGFPDNRYQIVVLTTRPMDPASPNNPLARQLVLMRWDNLRPAVFLAPLTIDLEALGPPDVERTFDAYLKPLEDNGFRVTYQLKGSVAAACGLHASYSYRPSKGPIQEETYEYLLTTRNIF